MAAGEYDDEDDFDAKALAAASDMQERLEELQSDYQRCFNTPAGEKVLLSLYDFCRQMKTTFISPDADPNGRYMTLLEGRRSVILEILKYLTIDDREIIERMRDAARKASL